jgi:hypothetical protein
MKMMASWFREGRGLALGILIGALTLGKASPYLVNAIGSADWPPIVRGGSNSYRGNRMDRKSPRAGRRRLVNRWRIAPRFRFSLGCLNQC